MGNKLLTHPELYDKSLDLQDAVKKFKASNKLKELEKTLLELASIYNALNFCEEDEYLEDVIDCYLQLIDVCKHDDKKLINYYEKIIENYDYLIQRDMGDAELLINHVHSLKKTYSEYKALDQIKDILKEYPRLKRYLDQE